MANNRRTYEGVYNALKQISDKEGVDFGLDGMSQEQFKNKYFTGPGNIENLYNRLTEISDKENIDFGQGSRDEWLSSFGYKRNMESDKDKYKYLSLDGKRIGGKPSPSSQQVLNDAQQTLNENQRVINRIGNQEQRIGLDLPQEPIRLGQNRKVTKGQPRFNMNTGKMENTYVTPSGNEYESRELADLEQNAIDQAEWERNNPKQALKNRIDSQINGIDSRMEGYEGQWVDADGRVHYSGGSAGDEAMRNLENARHDLMEARLQMDRTEQLHKSSDFLGGVGIPFTKDFFNNWKNFGYAVWDRLSDVGWWEDALSGGVNDLEKAGAYMKIKNKLDSGQQLTDQEMDVVLAGMATAQAQQYTDLPMGYKAGEITADMAPFMAQMAVNPASGFGRALARQAVRRYGRHGIGAVSKRVAARVLGNLGEAAVLSNTLQAPRTIGNVLQRYTGDSFMYDEDGNVHMGRYEDDENGEPVFVEGGKGALRSAYEGEVSSIIENFTELGAGGSVNKFVKRMANSKAGRALGIGYLSDLVGKVGSTPFAKKMGKFMERTHWDGMIEEPLEEEYGIILNAMLGTGDNKISDLWDSEQQAQIFAGTLWFGGMMSAMNTAAYPLYRRKLKQQLAQADINGQIAFGEEWELMKEGINNMDDQEIGNYLYSIKDNEAFNGQQRAALFGYAARLKQEQGSNVGDMLMRMEGNLSQVEKAEREAYETGAEAETPDEKKQYVEDAVMAELNLSNYGKEFATLITTQSDNPANTLDYLLNHRDLYTDEQIEAAADYFQKQARAYGVLNAAEDAINTEVERANAEVRANTHQATGSVVSVQDNDGDYFVLSGDIDPTTGQLIGTGGAMVVKNMQTGEVVVKSPQQLTVTSISNADDLIQQNETTLREQLTQQADDDITYGSPANEVFDMEDTVTLQDGQGGTIEGQVVALPNAVDGVYVVQTADGKALQMTADELNRRIVNHNGVEVKSAAVAQQPTQQGVGDAAETITEQGATVNNAGGEAGSEQTSANEPPASALSRIPVKMEGDKPVTDRKGRPVRDWHKASVEDAAAALVETTGGDMLMARDTAKDLIDKGNAKLEKIRKQKPKGEDPLEIAESRMEIRRQEQEQQAIIKQWKDVNQHIQQQMEAESQRKIAEREAAKSEEQRQREAEEARIRKEQQDEQDRQRLREQIERDREKRNKEYEPLTQAKREMADRSEAMAILDDIEPRSLEEWVSSQLRPHSMLWQDASDSETGLQTELGMKRADMQRMMSLLGTKESGAKPFGQVVLDIHEGLPEAMKEQYTDQDVRNTLLNLFNEGNSTRMMHLTEEHRIEEARELMKEMERREAEAEMDAWCEAYHLTPEERDTFEDFMQQPPSEPEQEIINNIIIDGEFKESLASSETMDQEPVSGTAVSGTEGGESQVQEPAQSTGNGTDAEAVAQGSEAPGSEPTVSDNQVSGGTPERDAQGRRYVDIKANLKYFFDNIGVENGDVIVDRMSTYELDELLALVEDWETINSEYGEVIEEKTADLNGKDKKKKEAAKKAISAAEKKANEAFVPIEEYVAELSAKYNSPEYEEEGAIPRPKIDDKRLKAIRQKLIDTYSAFLDREMEIDRKELLKATKAIRDYVDEGLDAGDGIVDPEAQDYAEVYDGNDPQKLADEYIVRVFQDRYLDDDTDQEYIKTGLKPNMRFENKLLSYKGKQFETNDNGIVRNPNVIEKRGKGLIGFEIRTALSEKGWSGAISVNGPTYGMGSGVSAASYDKYFETEKECQAYWALLGLQYLEKNRGDAKKDVMLPFKVELRKIAAQGDTQKQPSVAKWSVDGSTTISPVESQQPADTENISALGQSSEDKGTNNISNIQENLGKTSSQAEISSEEAKVDTNPSEAQKEAGNYQKGHINIDGYDITIENPKGSVRRGRSADGTEWETLMNNTYGYIRGTEGVDGDHIDVFLSDDPTSGNVYVVDQVNPDTGEFDEHKVMYGFKDANDAKIAYFKNYSKGWKGFGKITEVSREEFKKWVESSHRKTKPFAEYKSVKPAKEHKYLVSDEEMEEIRKKLLAKLHNLNAGIDPELMLLGAMYAGAKIERGFIKFADYAREMVNSMDDTIRPYLKSLYNAIRDLPEAQKYADQMDDYDTVQKFDVFNFDKGSKVVPAIEKAEQVTKEQKVKREVKKIKAEQPDLFAGSLFDAELMTKPAETEPHPTEQKKEGKQEQVEPKYRPLTEADLDNGNPTVYYQGKPSNVMLITRQGEQTSATTFSKPTISSVTLTNGKSVKLSDLMVRDDVNGKPAEELAEMSTKPKLGKPKGKTPWWNDKNRPESIDPSDYKTYMTDEAKTFFANHPAFESWKRKDLAFVTAAVWDGVVIPYEDLKSLPEIIEAEQIVENATANGVLQISDEERDQHAQHLLDAEHGSAIFENGKIKKVNGVEDFSGPVRQERKALVIIGYPAAGKSSVFANRLSNENGARIIDSDTVKPWLEGFDDGNGAGYVQDASSEVAERALDIAVGHGDNIILPRIGGPSVIMLSTALKLAGYDVQLYFNDVATVTSINRATSRFAETGRYLSLQYLTSKDGIPSKNFINFAEKKIDDYVKELSEGKVQKLRGRLGRLLESETVDGKRLWQSSATDQGGYSSLDEYLSVLLGIGGTGVTSRANDLIFSYAEWKSNDVAYGEKPKEIWNSKSGKPMPTNDKDNEGEQKVPGESSPVGGGTGETSRPADGAGAERSTEQDRAERSGLGRTVTEAKPKPQPKPKKNLRNNHGERGKDYAPTSPKARFNANVAAIKLMRELMDNDVENPTDEQKAVLRQYSGWGGLGTFFNDESSAENAQLRDLLTEEEYKDAVMSINSAYYTPATVIDTLWDVAKAMGFKGGNVLEGSAGIGNIIGQMPKDMSLNSDIEAVEIDTISGNILKLLYPDAKVHVTGFQDVVIPNNSVDLAVTNVPFVTGLHVYDKADKDLSRRFTNIHDFCIAKNIRKLREGGIGLFITSSGTLDKSNDLRAWIANEGQADVVGAFRLNNETFGGTNVTSDIIVVRKRTSGRTSEHAIDVLKASPLKVGTYKDKLGEEHQVSMTINDYFKTHPEMMAGDMAFGYEKGDTFRPGSYGLYPVAGKDQNKMMQDFVKQMEKVGKEAVVTQQPTQQAEPNQLTAEKEGRMLVDDKGRLCVSERGQAVPLQLNATKVKGYTKEQCFKDYQEVQQAVDDVLQQQLSDPDDAALKPKLDALNKAFDKFVKRYGNLHKNTSIAFLRNDIDFPSFLALENYSESKDIHGKVTVQTSKTPLFRQRVLGFKTEPEPKTVKDAIIASIFRTNGIDLEWIAAKLSEVAAPPNGDHWTADDVRKGILVSRLGFENPETGQLEIRYKYLSGNVREKLAQAEAYNQDGKYNVNIEELKKVIPMDIPAHLIDFSLGSSWIPIEIYNDYLSEIYGLNNAKLTHIQGSWILYEGSFRDEKNRSAGVYSEMFNETIYGHELVAAALNNRPVKVQKQITEGYGSSKTTHTETDQVATQACAVRVDEIKDEFKQFAKKKIQEDPELAQRIEKIYNDKFNALVPMQIDDEFLPERFEGANMNVSLYGHQKRGVMRGVTAPTMLAHEVGTGKSFTLITTAMEMRRLGTAKKPMIVVQNATVAQMTADAKMLYPNAKVLSLSEKDRSAEGRRSFYAKIKFNDWDLIIVPQSTFERIPDSPERELQFIQEKIDEKKHVIEMARQTGANSRELSNLERELKNLEQEYGDKYLDNSGKITLPKKKKKDAKRDAASLDKAETRAREQLDREVDDVQYFDDLGVDALLVDEAHEYKHLGFQTSIGRGIKGIDPSYSKKCAGLYNKTRSVFERAGWKNVVFATGTPISNTAAEIWTFMKYLMPADVMKANDIYYFDDFVHNFGNISQMLEFSTSGKFKETTRFAAYVNKPELIRIWSQVADTVLTKEVGKVQEKIPEQEGGKDQDIFLPQSPSLIRIMAAVRRELERFEKMTGKEKKENSSIPITMYGIAKRAAIDPRLVDASAPDEPMSKTNAAVKEILKDLEATKDYKGTVAVFCDNQNRKGADGSIQFNIYDDMKAKLIKAGVPESQIAIIKSGMSIIAKQKVFDAVNSGDIRVVLGSTQTLGTGVNMQERLHLLIHMDAPDRPMDYTQRNGRIKRQGNLHKQWGKTIRVIRFGVEDSLDVTAYQRLKTKSGFIDSIMDGKGALSNNQVDRTVEEEEEGLFDNPVAVLSGSQYALKKNQAERELRKYQSKKAQWENDQIYVNSTLKQNKRKIKASDDTIKKEEKALAHIRSLFPDGKVKTITVEGTPVDMSKEDAYGKVSTLIKEKINDPVNAIVKRNRENAIYNDETLNYTIELDGHPITFTVDVVRESVVDNGRMRTVIHKWTTYKSADLRIGNDTPSSKSVRDILDEILEQVVTGQDYQDRITAMQQRIDRLNEESAQLQQRVGMEFQFGKELEEAKKHVEEYTELMKKEMEEKEAKYAAQQKEAQENGGFDLRKAEDNDEDDEVRYSADEDIEPTTTDNFKAWFGDWENDPEHASKVVNEDGTPKVVYHGTNLTRNNHSVPFYEFYPDSHFGTDRQARNRIHRYQSKEAMDFDMRLGFPMNMEQTKIYPVFLNIKNPMRTQDVPKHWEETHSEWWEQQIALAKREGYDGIVYENRWEDPEHPADSYIAFYPEQIKSADENVGTYDANNPDIRHRMNEEFEDGETHPITVTYGYSSYDVLRRTATYSTDLMPDEYGSEQSLLDAVRTAYPNYYVRIENGNLVFDSWKHVMQSANVAEAQQQTQRSQAHISYIERKTRNAINAVTTMAQQMGLDVEVLTTTEGLAGKKARAKGWFNAKTGKITLVLPNHSNQFDLVNTLLHEGVAHFGLRKMFGQNFDTFLDNVYNNVAPEIKARIDAAIKRNGWSRHEATEEYLARLAERTDFEQATESGWWQKIKDFFMNMLAQAGFNTELTDNELRYILWRSYDNLLHPDSRRNIFDTARDVEMKRKLGVNRYVKERERLQRTGLADTSWLAAEVEQESPELFSIRTKEPPKKTGKGYKVFVLKDGQLYPPMVANPNGEGTPVGVWLDADAAPVAGTSKTGRPQVKAGGKGTQGGSGQLAYRPGWHLGTIPYALQFGRKDENGERTLFPNNFVWAEVEYADDVDYQDEARQEGMNANGKYQHSLAGLKHVPTDGNYKYRTNPDPRTDEWIITGAMRVNKILTREEVDELVRKAGREPQRIQEGDIVTDEAVKELNDEIKATKEADEMGLLYRDDDDGFFVDNIAQHAYKRAVASDSIKWQEAWQDSMAGLKAIQDAIAKETGNVATGAEDAYHFENRMHGRAKNMAERYDWQYYRPMLKAFNDFCKAKGMTHEQGLDYLIAKSGLERNMYYAFRDAMKEKLTETIKNKREKLEKDYAKNRIDELEYKRLKADLAEQVRTGVDDAIQQLHETLAWQRAKEDHENGNITFDELLRRRESLIRGVVGNLYDRHAKDFSGLTETFAKKRYDDAQRIKKDAQQAIDPKGKRMLWSAYYKAMKEAYKVAYQVAVDDVFGAEDGAVKLQTELWEKINAATKETLKHSYESGLMERKTYQKVGSMFDYYLPLRGWDEDKASDVYTYMGNENVFSPAVKKTWGRTSKSENPLAYIGNIAMSTILSGHRNLMKQHFLNYVMNNPTSLVNISESWYENIGNEGESPVWVLRTADTAGKSADEIVDIVNDFNEEMRLKQNEGKAMPVTGRLRLDVHATSGQKAEHVVEVQRAGHTYQLYINGDPKAAQALNGSAARAVSRISDTWLGRRITSINRSMAEFFTSKNPAFIISNLSRDLNMAGASVAVNEGAEYNARFIANAAKVLSPRVATGDVSKMGLLGLVGRGRGVTGMMPKLMRKYQDGKLNTRNETERYFKEFMEEGGETGFVNMLSVDSFKEKMRKEVAQMNGSSLFGSKNVKEVSVTKALRLLGETFEFYNRCAEDATRFIVYMTSRQMGKTLEESIADAKDVTLNFNRKGTGEKGNAELRDLFIFVNPAIQALANMYRMAKGHPLKFGAVTTAFIVGGALMPIINNWLLNLFGDDDDKDSYWNLPPWVRKNNLVFWIPGTKNFVTIPLAQEFRVFYGIGEMASSVAMEHPVDKWGLEVFSSVADLVPINPTGNGGNLMVDFAPTMVQPLMQIGENIDFTGRPIWRENQGNKYAPMYTKAYVSTPKWMTKISEGINDLTGGNEGKKGVIEKYSPIWGDYINNPAVWNHLMQGYFGGMYNTIAKGFDVGVTAASGEMPKVYQTPIINRFLNRPVERDNAGVLGEDYYHMTEQRDALQYELKVWKKKAADSKSSGDTDAYETAQEHVDEILSSQGWKRAEVINHYEKIIKDLRAGEKAAEGEDKQNIKRSISLYKQQMMEELAAIDNGKGPMEAAIEQFSKAKTLSEKKKLKLRIERLTKGDTKKPADSKKAVEKALSYQQMESADSKNAGSDRYLELATAENIRDDARIKAVKALARPYTQHYKELTDAGKHKEAAQYRQENLQWFTVSQSIGSHERAIANNRKLLGKGNDKAIMRIIDTHRNAMLRAIDQLD